jgi:hypothetical protein
VRVLPIYDVQDMLRSVPASCEAWRTPPSAPALQDNRPRKVRNWIPGAAWTGLKDNRRISPFKQSESSAGLRHL